MSDAGASAPAIPGVANLAEIGRSAAATTYRGTDASGRSVIVKVLHRDATADVRSRFDYDQARLAELREHPDIVVTTGHGYTEANHPYLVMEELSGGSLADRVGSGMDGPGVIAIGVKLAGALESAHRRNLVHGDLRPEDVLVTQDGEPHIADLGLALVTGVGPDRATEPARIAHAAPEQLETHVPTRESDIYALGSVLYALLAGSPAFLQPGDTSPLAVAVRIGREPVPDIRSLNVPDVVADVIEKAMARNPADRWESAEAFGHALQQAEVSIGQPITPMTVVGQDITPPRPDPAAEAAPEAGAAGPAPAGAPSKKRSPVLLIVAVLVLAAAVGAFFVLSGGDDDTAGDDDERTTVTRADVLDLVDAADDSGTIDFGRLEKWDDVDGRPLTVVEGVTTPDVIAAEGDDAAANFLGAGGFAISGIEITLLDAPAMAALGLPAEAATVLEFRTVTERRLAAECNTALEPEEAEVAGFDGLLQRFEGCDGIALAVFAGVDGAGQALVVEAHLVDDEDEAAIEDVLDSIEIG
jgi:hypothetical protein